jgi:hypothetical protein
MTAARASLALLASAWAVAVSACTEIGTESQLKHLERPNDVSFGCLQFVANGADTITQAVPNSNCSGAVVVPDGGLESNPIAFVTESTRGDVAVVDLSGSGSFVDSDPYVPGLNGIPAGRLPAGIVTTSSGCHAVVANVGSCDLSLIDVAGAFKAKSDVVHHLALTSAGGQPFAARPAGIEAPPSDPASGPTPDCTSPSGSVFVTYPACHLVARIDVGTGKVLDGVRLRPGAAPQLVGPEVTCPAECGGASPAPAGSDAGVAPGPQNLTVAIEGDGSRLYIGAQGSPTLVIAELDRALHATALRTIDLAGATGLRKIALSTAGARDNFVGLSDRWAYVLAEDGAIHVASVRAGQDPVECDTQIDRRFLHARTDPSNLGCFRWGDPTNPPRRVDAIGPGVRLPAGAVPLDLGFFIHPRQPKDPVDISPQGFYGSFVVVTALGPVDDPSSGRGVLYYINVDDEMYPNTETALSDGALGDTTNHDIGLGLPHTLRDGNPARFFPVAPNGQCLTQTLSDSQGAPRIAVDPGRPTNYVYNDNGAAGSAFAPSLHRVTCPGTTAATWESAFSAPTASRAPLFPDLEKSGVRGVAGGGSTNEQVLVAWEGPLVAAGTEPRRNGAAIEVGHGGMVVHTPGALLCELGVQAGDIFEAAGCDLDTDCRLGESCVVHPDAPSGVSGMCFPSERAADLRTLCRGLLTTSRRYTVTEAADNHAVVVTRPRILDWTPIDGCSDGAQCMQIEDSLFAIAEAADSTVPVSPRHTFSCEADPAYGGPKRCLYSCQGDSDCVAGSSCELSSGHCVLGPLPPPDCVAPLQRYTYRTGDAFSVTSTSDEYRSREVVDPNSGLCVEDQKLSPLAVQRVPRLVPDCTDLSVTAIAPNPCHIPDLTEPVPAQSGTGYDLRPAYGIRVRSLGVTFDLTDVAIPHPSLPGVRYSPIAHDYAMLLQFAGGFFPLAVQLQAALPERVRVGPGGSLILIDSGDIAGQVTTGQILTVANNGSLSSNRLR